MDMHIDMTPSLNKINKQYLLFIQTNLQNNATFQIIGIRVGLYELHSLFACFVQTGGHINMHVHIEAYLDLRPSSALNTPMPQ